MKCPRCQYENRSGAKFCEECATPLARTCSNCDSPLSATAKFCPECAHPVAGITPAGARFASPQSYTPKHLAEKILTSKSALEGERKQVTVLFADLKGSMELLAGRDPEDARVLLDSIVELLMEAVHSYEGTVNQIMGDGIMALFGAPIGHEDHGVRACYAALQMQESFRRYADELRRNDGPPIDLRVGLNSGEVVVRSISNDLRMDYSAIGQTTHLAARMEQLASPGSILMTADTFRLVDAHTEVQPLGPMPVKGLPEPIDVFRLLGKGANRSRLSAAAASGDLTRFVGRANELEVLHQALECAGTGDGRVVAVVGEPGVGKSRLYWEFVRFPRTREWLILEGGAVSYGKATAYLPVIDLLRRYFQIERHDDGHRIRQKVVERLLAVDRALQPTTSAFLWLLDVPFEDAQWQLLDPPQRRRRTIESVKQLFVSLSLARPLLLLFEDLHRADSETLAVLDNIVESVQKARVLLLVNYRPEYQHRWTDKTYCREIPINPLPPEAAGELLDYLLGSTPELAPLKRLLITRTEGNPFFIEENVRTLVETKIAVGERGAYSLTRPLGNIQVPATVQATIAARIDRLLPSAKWLLQTASVVGKDVPFSLLQAIAALSDDELRAGLTTLQIGEFFYETNRFPELEFTFKHSLTHEVAYRSLLRDRRRALHRAVVTTIETLYGDRLSDHAQRLAHHALSGHQWEKAVTYGRQAGAKALARSANREAAAYFEQALDALARLPAQRDMTELAIDLRFDLRTALTPLAELEQILQRLHEAEDLIRTLDDPHRAGWLSAYLSHAYWLTSQTRRAINAGQVALGIAKTSGDAVLEIVSNYYLGTTHFTLGDYRPAIGFLRQAITRLEGDLAQQRLGLAGFPSSMARAFVGLSLGYLGSFSEAALRGQEAVDIAETLDHPYSLALALMALGTTRCGQGNLDHAIQLLSRCADIARDWNLAFVLYAATGTLGYVRALSGHVVQGLDLLQNAVSGADSARLGLQRSFLYIQLAEVYLIAGRIEDAVTLADRALMLARSLEERRFEVSALLLSAEIASRQLADAPSAEHLYSQAMDLATSLGLRPLVARAHLGLARLYGHKGMQSEAQRYLTVARAMYQEMEMFPPEKAEW